MSDVRIENWSISMFGDAYTPPEAMKAILQGNVYNHPKIQDGTFIETSVVKELKLEEHEAQTSNTIYKLGKPDENWLAWLRLNGNDEVEKLFKSTNDVSD